MRERGPRGVTVAVLAPEIYRRGSAGALVAGLRSAGPFAARGDATRSLGAVEVVGVSVPTSLSTGLGDCALAVVVLPFVVCSATTYTTYFP